MRTCLSRWLVVAVLITGVCGLEDRMTYPRAAFLYLVHPARLDALRSSLSSLQNNFLSAFPGYPVYLFHDWDLTDEALAVPTDVHAENVHWVFLQDYSTLPMHHVDDHTEGPHRAYASSARRRLLASNAISDFLVQVWGRVLPHDTLLVDQGVQSTCGCCSGVLLPNGHRLTFPRQASVRHF